MKKDKKKEKKEKKAPKDNSKNVMRNLHIRKLCLNICVGESGDRLTRAAKVSFTFESVACVVNVVLYDVFIEVMLRQHKLFEFHITLCVSL